MIDATRFAIVAACALFAVSWAPASLVAQEEGPTDAASVPPPEDEQETTDDEDKQKEDDEDDEDDDEDDDEQRLETSFLLTSEVHSMNNLDLRPLDESTDQSILETDDRNTFGYTGLSAELTYEVLEDTDFDFAASHTGMWGSDQLGGLSGAEPDEQADYRPNQAYHFLWIYRLSANWHPIENDSFGFQTTVGRQDFEIGGAEDDFFLDDTLDAVTLEFDFGLAGKVRALALDFYGSNSSPEHASFVNYVGRNPTVMGFRGDTNTLRHGLVYENTQLLDGLELRGFGFYADIGAGTGPGASGSDRSRDGALGNISDNDDAWLAGTRAGYTHESDILEVGGFGEFARSGGIDRKDIRDGLLDVSNEGNAYGAGLHAKFKPGGLRIDTDARWFHADGGYYNSDGIRYGHGFVSFKGDEIGGINLDRYAGFHPSAYVGPEGIEHAPQQIERRSGSEVVKAGLGVLIAEKLRIDFEAWHLWDNSVTKLDFDNLEDDASDLPFGYTEADLRGQQRFGKSIGTELNTSVLYRANRALNFYAKGGAFLPSEYYEIPVSRTSEGTEGRNQYTLQGSRNPAPFWAIAAGTTLNF